MPWLFVAVAIAAELVGTLGLRQLANSVSWWSVVIIVLAYATSFGCLGLALRHLNVGVVYALWSGIGTAVVSAAGALLFSERLGWQAVVGMSLIVVGICVLVSSGTVHHNPTAAEPSSPAAARSARPLNLPVQSPIRYAPPPSGGLPGNELITRCSSVSQ